MNENVAETGEINDPTLDYEERITEGVTIKKDKTLTIEQKVEIIKEKSDVAVRRVSRRLDEINTYLNQIDISLESVCELFCDVQHLEDPIALITLHRICKKYKKLFDNWEQFFKEDIHMCQELSNRYADFNEAETDKIITKNLEP